MHGPRRPNLQFTRLSLKLRLPQNRPEPNTRRRVERWGLGVLKRRYLASIVHIKWLRQSDFLARGSSRESEYMVIIPGKEGTEQGDNASRLLYSHIRRRGPPRLEVNESQGSQSDGLPGETHQLLASFKTKENRWCPAWRNLTDEVLFSFHLNILQDLSYPPSIL